jgi:DNA-binding transcriptional LysR family regulator
MKSLKGIASFAAVANSGSFAAAAKRQGVSAVAVSKNVATLERQLGVRLFHRTTRALKLTPEGQVFYDQCQEPLRELEAAATKATTSSQIAEGVVRVTCIPPIATSYLLPLMNAFHTQQPKVQIELHLGSDIKDMVTDGFDVGIRVGSLEDSSFIARSIAPLPFVVCASPAYWLKNTAPQTLTDLSDHDCIRIARTGNQAHIPWLLEGMTPAISNKLTGKLAVNDFAAAVQASVLGQGVVCAPLPLVMPFFRAGQLRPALTQHIVAKLEVYLHYLNRKNLPNRTRVFVDFVLNELRKAPDLQIDAKVLVAPFV